MYLQTNRKIYKTNKDKVAFVLSYMSNKSFGKKSKHIFKESPMKKGDTIPINQKFIKILKNYFRPANQLWDATHQLKMLKQGKKSAEEIITKFRLLVSEAGYT